MTIIKVQTNVEIMLGIPKFSGVRSVNVERTAGKNKGRREWLVIRYREGQATLPRGYKAVEDENGGVVEREV